MDYLIGWEPFETEFDGNKITMELLPLTNTGMVKIMPFLLMGEVSEGEATTKMFECQALAADIFPEHVRNITGFTINGKEPDGEMLSKTPVFASLVADIISRLSMISTLTQSESKNLKGQSGKSVEAKRSRKK